MKFTGIWLMIALFALALTASWAVEPATPTPAQQAKAYHLAKRGVLQPAAVPMGKKSLVLLKGAQVKAEHQARCAHAKDAVSAKTKKMGACCTTPACKTHCEQQ